MKTETDNIIQIQLPLSLLPVAYWSYEHAFCESAIVQKGGHMLPDDEADEVHQLHKMFADAFEVSQDNKQTFAVVPVAGSSDPDLLFVTFHDNRMFVGTGIRAYRGSKDLAEPDKLISKPLLDSWCSYHHRKLEPQEKY